MRSKHRKMDVAVNNRNMNLPCKLHGFGGFCFSDVLLYFCSTVRSIFYDIFHFSCMWCTGGLKFEVSRCTVKLKDVDNSIIL